MSLTITTDVSCDRCPQWVDGISAMRIKGKQARALANSAGWARAWNAETQSYEDLCQACQGLVFDGQFWRRPQ